MEKILLYTSSTCPHCKTAKDYLDQKGYEYEEKNVQMDQNAAIELQNIGAQGVPTLVVNGHVIVGFQPQKIEESLKTKVFNCPNCGKKMTVPVGKGNIKVTCPHCSHEFQERT